MLVRTFSDDDTTTNGSGDSGPEYVFEGFNVEFSAKVMLTTLAPSRSPLVTGQTASYQFSLDPDRLGTFIIPDIYQCDFSRPKPPGHGCEPLDPPFHLLPGMVVDGKEVVGCVVKATEGVSW